MQKERYFKENKKGCHAELDSASSTLVVSQGNNNSVRGRSRIKYGMTPLFNNSMQAFTLIELLVVVLIIGILAAVALPQYQKAVEKSKAVQAQTMLKTVYNAAKAYQLANGSWPTSFDELAVDIPWTGTDNWGALTAMRQGKSNADWSIQLAKGADYGVGVVVGRISGPYAGAAFAITDTARNSNSSGVEAPTEEMICIEGKTGNAVNYSFAKATGDYCVKLFKGTLVPTGHLSRYYTLP